MRLESEMSEVLAGSNAYQGKALSPGRRSFRVFFYFAGSGALACGAEPPER